MHTFISMLRGINVSGKNSIKMDALRELYSNLGFQEVQSYIQSGNVVFKAAESDTDQISFTIKKAILEQFGYDVPVLVLSKETLSEIIRMNTFATDPEKDPRFLHVTFLAEETDVAKLAKIIPENYLPDVFEIQGKAIYLYCPNGYGNTKLNNNFFESKLKVRATTRNWKTSQHLLNMCD